MAEAGRIVTAPGRSGPTISVRGIDAVIARRRVENLDRLRGVADGNCLHDRLAIMDRPEHQTVISVTECGWVMIAVRAFPDRAGFTRDPTLPQSAP